MPSSLTTACWVGKDASTFVCAGVVLEHGLLTRAGELFDRRLDRHQTEAVAQRNAVGHYRLVGRGADGDRRVHRGHEDLTPDRNLWRADVAHPGRVGPLELCELLIVVALEGLERQSWEVNGHAQAGGSVTIDGGERGGRRHAGGCRHRAVGRDNQCCVRRRRC